MGSFTASDGVEIAYDDVGPREARAALLIHGFASNRYEAWKRTGWYPAFERRGQRLVAYDQRGHGESGKPHDPDAYGGERLIADAVELMDHLGLERVDLFGYSMGSRVAAGVARTHPGRVANLILGGSGERSGQTSGAGDVMARAMEADDPAAIPHALLKAAVFDFLDCYLDLPA